MRALAGQSFCENDCKTKVEWHAIVSAAGSTVTAPGVSAIDFTFDRVPDDTAAAQLGVKKGGAVRVLLEEKDGNDPSGLFKFLYLAIPNAEQGHSSVDTFDTAMTGRTAAEFVLAACKTADRCDFSPAAPAPIALIFV